MGFDLRNYWVSNIPPKISIISYLVRLQFHGVTFCLITAIVSMRLCKWPVTLQSTLLMYHSHSYDRQCDWERDNYHCARALL